MGLGWRGLPVEDAWREDSVVGRGLLVSGGGSACGRWSFGVERGAKFPECRFRGASPLTPLTGLAWMERFL